MYIRYVCTDVYDVLMYNTYTYIYAGAALGVSEGDVGVCDVRGCGEADMPPPEGSPLGWRGRGVRAYGGGWR